jgi:hypothetical protein
MAADSADVRANAALRHFKIRGNIAPAGISTEMHSFCDLVVRAFQYQCRVNSVKGDYRGTRINRKS